MTEFLISRKGSNAANQQMCELQPLLLVAAEDAAEARWEFDAIWADSVTVYANQQIQIEAIDDLDPDSDEYDMLQEADDDTRRKIAHQMNV